MPLVEKTISGALDLALVWGDGANAPHAERIANLPIRWIGRADWPGVRNLAGEPLPFAAFSPPCAFRTAAIEALDSAGLPWRLAFTSPSLSGLWAAAEGGLGVTARTIFGMPRMLAVLDPAVTGLPPLPTVPLALHRAEAEPTPPVRVLTEILLDAIRSDRGFEAVAG